MSEGGENDFYYNYLTREIQIASSLHPEDLDSLTPAIYLPLVPFSPPDILFYNLPFLRNSLAEAYHRFGMLDKAIAEYERLITFEASRDDRHLINPRYHYYLGIIYQEKGMKDKAAVQFQKFLDLWQDADPGYTEPADAKRRLKE